MATPTTIDVSKIYILDTEPSNKITNRFWFDTSTNILKRYNKSSDAWESTSLHADNVEISTSGSSETVNLTTYLANNIAALAEGIDTKADSATTLAGYGITDAYNKTEVDTSLSTIESSIESKADADSTNTSIQSLKFDKTNNGYIQFGNGVSGRNCARGSLNQTIDCNNLTFCFQGSIGSNSLLALYGTESSSGSTFGIGVDRYTSGVVLTIGYSVTLKSYYFALGNQPTLDEAFVLIVEDVDFENATLTAKLYSSTFEGAMSPTSTGGTFPAEFQLTNFNVCGHGGNYPSAGGYSAVKTFKNLKAFNFILPLNDDNDTDSIGYTIEDYFNGKDEPPSLRDSTATNQALVSLVNYTCTVGTTRYITNIGTGANATHEQTDDGYMGGSKDDEINALADYITSLNDSTSEIEALQSDLEDLENSLATVATSGDYDDLTNKPTIPSLDGYATTSYVTDAISNKADLATTLSGYGITDAYTKTETLDLLDTNTPPYLEYVTDAFTLSPTSTTAGIQVSSEMKSGTIHIYPSISNSNACYLIRSSSAKPDVLIPYYPDQHSTLSVTNLSQWYLWCNNVGDSAILQLEVNNKETVGYSYYTADNPLCMTVDTSTNIISTLVTVNDIVTWNYTVMSDLALSTAKTALLLQDATGSYYIQASIVELVDNVYTWKLELQTGDITNTSGIVETLYFTNSDGETYTARIEVINSIPTWKLEIV